ARALMAQLGWALEQDVTSTLDGLDAIATHLDALATDVQEYVDAGDDDQQASAAQSKALGDVTDIAVAIGQLSQVAHPPAAFADPRLAEKLLDLLLYDYLADHQPQVFALVRLIGVLDEVVVDPATTTPPVNSPYARSYLRRTVDLSRFATAFTEPAQL